MLVISFIDKGLDELATSVISSCLEANPKYLLLTDLEAPTGLIASTICRHIGRAYNVALPYIGMTGWLPKRKGRPVIRSGDLKSDPWAVPCFEEDVRSALLDERWVKKEPWAWEIDQFLLWKECVLEANSIHVVAYGSQYSETKMAVGRRCIRRSSDLLYLLNQDGTVESEARGSS